jgi:carboxyl-terminal processing protease
VLTSRFSASASEILAGALQDYGRALIVGDISTHGKGTVQSVNELKPFMKVGDLELTNDPGALKITIAAFFRASGASTQLKGVTPDVILPSILNESEDIGETALDYALPWDTIDSAKYDPLNMVAPVLSEVKRRSAERVASGKDWSYVREDIQLFKKRQADKTLSLNEKVRLKEKNEEEARQKAREKERKARHESEEKIYEITLKNAGLPGLPPPVQKTNNLAKADSGTSTNALAEVPGKTKAEDIISAPGEDELDEEAAPAVDVTLQETEKILADYIALLRGREVAKTTQKN